MLDKIDNSVKDVIPIDEIIQLTPDKNQKTLMTLDWSLTNGAESHANEIAETVDQTPLAVLQNDLVEADKNYNEQKSINQVGEIAYNRADLLPEALKIRADEQKKDAEISKSSLGVSYAWVNSLKGSDALTRSEKIKLAADHSLSTFYAAKFDKQSWLDVGFDFVGMMAVPDDGYNTSKAVSGMSSNVSAVEAYLGTTEHINDLIAERASLPLEARIEWDNKLKEIVGDVDDNILQQFILNERLTGKDTLTDADLSLEAASIGLTAANTVGAVSLALASFGKKVARGITAVNRARMLSEAGDVEKAADLLGAVAKDPSIAPKIGVPVTEAQSAGNPLITKDLKDTVLKGAPEALSKKFRAYIDGVNEGLDYARDRINIQFDLPDVTAGRLIAKIDKELSADPDIEVLDIVHKNGTLEINYNIHGDDGVTPVQEIRRFTIDDAQGLLEQDASLLNSMNPTASPNFRLGVDRDAFVQQAEAIINARAKMSHGFTESFKAAWKPVKGDKKGMQNVSDMLFALDGQEVTPSYNLLVNVGVGGKRLNDKEFMAFQGVRRMLDDTFEINNYALRRELEIKGIRNVKVGETDHFSKVYKSPEAARMGFAQAEEASVFIADTQEVRRLEKASDMDDMLNNGYVLVKADSKDPIDWFETGGNRVRFALVKSESVTELPEKVLKRIPNYMPRIYDKANVFIQKVRPLVVDGKVREVAETIAFAATDGQAARYIQKLEAIAKEAGKDVKYTKHFDKDPIVAGRITDDQMRIAGGQFRADRKVNELIDASEVGGQKKLDALDTIQRYMQYTARRTPTAEWRMNVQQRLINEISTSLPEARGRRFAEMRGLVEASALTQTRKSKLLVAIDQVNGIMGVPTKAEQQFSNMLRAVGKAFDGKGGNREKVSSFLYNYKDQSAINFLKGRAFNLNLGMFSIVQLPVQAFGATMALAIDPVHAPKALAKWMAASLWDQGPRTRTGDAAMTALVKKMGMDADGFQKDWEFWRRSGMYDSVVASNADFATMSEGLLLDSGLLRRAYGSLEEKGQMFFKMGELANMRISFFTALERQKALDGAKFTFNDNTLRKVLARAEQYRLNMGAGNKAWFQRGIWSLPTQFKQIYTKFAEAMMGDWFTPRERFRVFASQAALFGMAGVPILNSFQDQIIDMFFDEGDLTERELITAKRGSLGFLFNDVMDIDAVVSGRMALASDYTEDLEKLFTGDVSMIEGLLGVSYSLFGRTYEALESTTRNTYVYVVTPPEEWDVGMVEDTLSDIAKSTLSLAASTRKALQAYDLVHADAHFAKSGQKLFEYPDGANMGTKIARAVGFSSQNLNDVYELNRAITTAKDKEKYLAEQMILMLHNWSIASDAGDAANAKRAARVLSVLRSHVDDFDTRERIMEQVLQKMDSRKFDEKTFKDWIEMRTSDMFSAQGEFSILAAEKVKRLGENK